MRKLMMLVTLVVMLVPLVAAAAFPADRGVTTSYLPMDTPTTAT